MKPAGYDAAYKREKYLRPFYYPHRWGWLARWAAIAELIYEEDKILEIGCGSGQLANLLFMQNKRKYLGFDFSEEGIKVCESLGLEPMEFCISNAYDYPYKIDNYDVIIICEVLEHLQDFKILELIKKGTKIVGSLPDFPAENHLFHINNPKEIYDRYEGFIDITYMSSKIDAWWVFEGVKI